MSDPYNSYPSHLPPPAVTRTAAVSAPQAAAQRGAVDPFARLDVSDKWKRRFRAIERAGGPDLPRMRDLQFSERLLITSNWWAFFLWPVYLPLKGLWRQAVTCFAIAFAFVLIMELMGLGKFARGVGYGVAAIAMLRANVGYYRKVVQGEAPWF